MIGIVDYGLGNLRSVAGALTKLGYASTISSDPSSLQECAGLILPGVGAFRDGMNNLHERGLVDALTVLVRQQGKPILGICLGAQLMASRSHEFGLHAGLGWIDAEVVPLVGDVRVPHVGWNEARQTRDSWLLKDIPETALFYYAHSYRLTTDDPAVVAASCDYGEVFPTVFETGQICATQFHPEKSQRHGLALLANFCARVDQPCSEHAS